MASGLASDNRKMWRASNAFPFVSLWAKRYWKSEQMLALFPVHLSFWRRMTVKSRLSGKPWCAIEPHIQGWCSITGCQCARCIQLSAESQSQQRELCQSTAVHQCNFPQMASFPKLPSSRPLVLSDDAESIIRCVWAAPVSTTLVGGTDIEWPFLHGSLILTQSLHLITMGTFHRVLDLINDFFPGLLSLFSLRHFSHRSLLLCSPHPRCSWADNPTSPGARPP